jgi:ATP-dependent DNA helicase RecQ
MNGGAAISNDDELDNFRESLGEIADKRPKLAPPMDEPTPIQDAALTATLTKYFGFTNYRGNQLAVIQRLLQKRDCAVFWPTGFGKSLCYCIPPLHLNQTAIVVSPLISLMQDQVQKLNGLLSNDETPLACFLGSGQPDANVEGLAMQGAFALVYVTPEKLSSAGFVDQLVKLDRYHKKICVLAVDEAHCVSEWGHDFRKDYRSLGTVLRTGNGLDAIPIVALTATATVKVQQDIITSLRLRNAFSAKQSFDRTNLKLSVFKKRAGGVAATFSDFVKSLARKAVGSTIIYAPTRSLVDEITEFLKANATAAAGTPVDSYHAGMSNEDRNRVHIGFLTGSIQVIVATVAFGMGIDKPDVRRVIHYGPPKTVEVSQPGLCQCILSIP